MSMGITPRTNHFFRGARVAAVSGTMLLASAVAAKAQCTEFVSALLCPLGLTQSKKGNLLVSESGSEAPNAGLRVVQFGDSGITEIGHYMGAGGNDFWGVYPLARSEADLEAARRAFVARQEASRRSCTATQRGTALGACLNEVNERERVFYQQQTNERSGEPLILMSDRDSGLWIFRYTGG